MLWGRFSLEGTDPSIVEGELVVHSKVRENNAKESSAKMPQSYTSSWVSK